MDSIVLELADALRTDGVRCSTAEVIDAIQAPSLCGVQGREVVKNALGITLLGSTFLNHFNPFLVPPWTASC